MEFALRQFLCSICLLPIAFPAIAGHFYVASYGLDNYDVAAEIGDLVSEGFTAEFKSTDYAIVAISNHARLGDDNLCNAVVGVSKRAASGQSEMVPWWRFTGTIINRQSGSMNVDAVRKCKAEAIRSAVENLMSVSPKEIRAKSEGRL